MELLNRLTIKNLKLNKKRTPVTIIGIILSTALITGVATLVSSFRSSLIEMEKRDSGNYHYVFEDAQVDDLKYIENNRNIERTFITQEVGYSKLEGSQNENKPYLYISAYTKSAFENLSINLKEGRLPENENELIISEHIYSNGKVKFNIGDEITLNIGKRMVEGYELTQSNPYFEEDDDSEIATEYDTKINSETITDAENATSETPQEEFIPEYTKKYKIVGIMERPKYNVEGYSAPGYTVLTYMQTPSPEKKISVYTRYKDLKKQNETTASILGITEKEFESYFRRGNDSDKIAEKIKFTINSNDSLIRWENLQFSEANTTMLYTIAGIIMIIIIVTSVFCIRNSFAISITEKTKQYGMLASVGATSKQIKKNVLYEGLILGIIGIPLGILSGLLAIFIVLNIVERILANTFMAMDLIFSTSIIAILISIVLSSITIYLSAKKSAKRAAKVSPIEAIRGNEDIKIKSKKLKSPIIIKKLFGIGGVLAHKNLKRNNKKYRTTVISIVVSVSIFIAMSSFMNYAFKLSGIYYTDYGYNVVVQAREQKGYETLKKIVESEEVKSHSLIRSVQIDINPKELASHYTKNYSECYNLESNLSETTTISGFAIGKEEYKRYIKELGLKYDDVKDKIIIMNSIMTYTTINGKSSYQFVDIYDYKKGNKISGEIDNKKVTIEVAATTDRKPKGMENNFYHSGYFIISDEFIEKYKENISGYSTLYIDAKDPDKLEEHIKKEYNNDIENVINYENEARQQKSMWLVISIFLYGFITVISLIGVTNIFNTITTNMELRQKEFANLKSIGMTKKEFNRMISLESIMYGTKSLIFGIPIGIGLSYWLYNAFEINMSTTYEFPITGILISIAAVIILVGTIMRYSLNKINKQNIIETIRKDNI